MKAFPEGFLWGAASAAHQVEGNNVNNDVWVQEQIPGTFHPFPSGDAVDHYHRYREDIAMMAEIGINTYRFSLEWARIEPEEGQFSDAELNHYRQVLETCHRHGITPMVTLHHFSSPRWLMQFGGWGGEETPRLFARYCEKVFEHMGELIPYASTLNEVNLPLLLSHYGVLRESEEIPDWRRKAAALCGAEPERFVPFLTAWKPEQICVMMEAHRLGRETIKRLRPETKVGLTLALPDFQALSGGEGLAERMWQAHLHQFAEHIQGDDYLGLQNYGRDVCGPDGIIPWEQRKDTNQTETEMYPEGVIGVIREASKLGIPIIITENGYITANDELRVEFIRRAARGIHACLNDGIDVRGYIVWSWFDAYEWPSGFNNLMGLVSVDRATQERKPKESAKVLGALAKTNGTAR